MKKTFFVMGLAVMYTMPYIAEEQSPAAIYEFLCQQVPATKALHDEARGVLKPFCDDLSELMQEMTLKLQELENKNAEGARIFMELIDADDLMIALHPIKQNANDTRLDGEESILLDEEEL